MLRRRLILYLTRSIFTFTVILTLTLAALDVQTHRNPTVFTRNSWDLSASLDRWSTMNVIFFRGYFIVDNVEEIQPAFTGQFMTDVPFSPNRTDPVGIQWQRTDNANQITINRPGLGDSPRPLAHLGLLWKSPTDAPGSFGSNRFRNWWFQINLLFPLLLSTACPECGTST